MSIETIAGAALVKTLKKAWRKDRDHRYRLNQPWSLPRLVEPVPDYHGRYVTIEDGVITIQPSDICDGATLAPDKVGKWVLIEAALAHDALYAELDQIAEEWAKTITELDAAIRNIERGRPAMVDGVSYGPADKDELIEWRDRISDVRKWADDVFFGLAIARAPHWLARLYWCGVRAGGGIAHAVGRLLALLVLAAVVAGFGGCSTPVDPFGGQAADKPDYERIDK